MGPRGDAGKGRPVRPDPLPTPLVARGIVAPAGGASPIALAKADEKDCMGVMAKFRRTQTPVHAEHRNLFRLICACREMPFHKEFGGVTGVGWELS